MFIYFFINQHFLRFNPILSTAKIYKIITDIQPFGTLYLKFRKASNVSEAINNIEPAKGSQNANPFITQIRVKLAKLMKRITFK